MKWLTNFHDTSIGRKQVMAITGLMLSGFLVTHLSGNFLLLVDDGGELFNAYAEWIGGQVWLNAARGGLLAALIVHLFLAFTLSSQNRAARKTDYYYKDPSDASMASRYMLLTGVLILGFVIVHLFQFTWASHDVPGGLYGVVIGTFTNFFWATFYISLMVVLGMHLSHALSSVFQTFGIAHKTHTPLIKLICLATAIGFAAGFAFIPFWILITKGGVQ